ncbi:MAG: hypothetical protein GWO16_07205 [Gammaproteobacteria bacterium]|nr:hypothetical protein [Gammaproteobacteria bacterium]NIR97759.1 hypothetical protein [Gammaproteobacteria bacterium]NIT63469.1 hypothetical protein [Gammaproteobacteria bacterium]NIV20401.1 hypothetical protein [Gammaproteobacteria bacterium]NIX10919.1 hypothetical protein [Gammaproteobacteria bacterium]
MRAKRLGLLVAVLLPIWATAAPGPAAVPVAEDLRADARLAARDNLVLMLVFSAYYCENCEILENEIVRPMVISGEYDDKVIIRKVRLDEGDYLYNFKGESELADDFAGRNGIRGMPTIMFLDHRGRRLADPILGINTIPMFSGRVDAAIERSLEMLRKRVRGGDRPARES